MLKGNSGYCAFMGCGCGYAVAGGWTFGEGGMLRGEQRDRWYGRFFAVMVGLSVTLTIWRLSAMVFG